MWLRCSRKFRPPDIRALSESAIILYPRLQTARGKQCPVPTALASALHLNLFQIDLAAVVSKFTGETERNLDRIFSSAEISGSILFFDEADALFGKRSEVNDAHER